MKLFYFCQVQFSHNNGQEIVNIGNETAFFITRDTPVVITPYKPDGLRTLVGEASRIHLGGMGGGFLVVGSVDEIADAIRRGFEESI
jgi:hypothetical protein